MKFKYLTILILTVIISCTDEVTNEHPIAVSSINDKLVIKNQSNTDLYFAVFPESIIHLIDWAPITSEENKLFPSQTIHIPLDTLTDFGQIPGNEPLAFYYWEAVERDGKVVAGSLSNFIFNPNE